MNEPTLDAMETEAHKKKIKSAQILSSSVSLGLSNFPSPPQHGGGGGDRSNSGNEFHSAASDLFTSCLPSLGRSSEISFRLTFCRHPPIDRFPRQTWDDFAFVCVRRLPHRSPARLRIFYLRLSTLLFVHRACGLTPAS